MQIDRPFIIHRNRSSAKVFAWIFCIFAFGTLLFFIGCTSGAFCWTDCYYYTTGTVAEENKQTGSTTSTDICSKCDEYYDDHQPTPGPDDGNLQYMDDKLLNDELTANNETPCKNYHRCKCENVPGECLSIGGSSPTPTPSPTQPNITPTPANQTTLSAGNLLSCFIQTSIINNAVASGSTVTFSVDYTATNFSRCIGRFYKQIGQAAYTEIAIVDADCDHPSTGTSSGYFTIDYLVASEDVGTVNFRLDLVTTQVIS